MYTVSLRWILLIYINEIYVKITGDIPAAHIYNFEIVIDYIPTDFFYNFGKNWHFAWEIITLYTKFVEMY